MPAISRPNLLLLVCSGLNARDLEVMARSSSTRMSSSALLSLAAGAKSFACDLPDPRPGPNRACLMTGRWPQSHGLWADGVRLPLREERVSVVLANAGYDCALVGASHLAPVAGWRTEARPDDDGFRVWQWAHAPAHRARQNAYIAFLKSEAPEVHDRLFPTKGNPDELQADPALLEALAALPRELSFNHWVAQSAIEFIDAPRAASQPWFVVAGLQLVAEQCSASLASLDAELGQLLEALTERAVDDDTLIILTSDRATGDGRKAEDSRVPLIIRHGAGCTSTAADSSQQALSNASTDTPREFPALESDLASVIDVAPTLCAAAGLPARYRHQGVSLLERADVVRRQGISTFREGSREQLTQARTAITMDRYRLVFDHDQDGSMPALYDLKADPEEHHDIAEDPQHAERIEAMSDRLLASLCAREDRTQPLLGGF